MAAGLDELIEYLLEEIALGGQTGITFLELATLVNQFYQPSSEGQRENEGDGHETTARGTSSFLDSDRQFLSKVWTWLSRHPDVSVGSNCQFNDKSLDDIEKIYPGYTNPAPTTEPTGTAPTALVNTAPQQHDDAERSVLLPLAAQKDIGPRLFVSEDRMSLAITGHLPDPARIVASEWALLSCIAVSRKNGIMQGDLIRVSKQDKRSVPKRTDALHQKGYILKKPLYVKGNKTSRLYLRRFADAEQSTDNSATPIAEQLTIVQVARQLFDVLKNNPLIPQEDLSEVLGMKSFGRARILLQLIRQFTKLGCLKRVKTAFAPSAKSRDVKICIQFLKEPSDEDWRAQSTQDIDLNQSIELLASLYEANAEQSDEGRVEADVSLETNAQNDMLATDSDIAVDTRSLLPQWNPDRVLANVVVEILQAKGSEGATNAAVKNKIAGPFVRRILESLLVKMSNRALQAQPPNLRHLSVIRTSEVHDGVLRYLHYAFGIFIEKVVSGHAKWEDAAGGSIFLKESERIGRDILTLLKTVECDEFGFVLRSKLPVHPHDGEATMEQLLRDAKVKDLKARPGEPELKRFDDGHLELLTCGDSVQDLENQIIPPTHLSHGRLSSEQPTVLINQSTRSTAGLNPGSGSHSFSTKTKIYHKPKRVDKHGQPIKGRPRKFTRGTEKYWRDVCTFIIQERNPDSRKRLNKAGITTDPEAQRVFNGRPAGFDEVVLQAIERKLPVAATACDINEKWMVSMTTIMSRSQPGLYITPLGYQHDSGRRKARTFILRSKRLIEIDWSDRKQCWPWQQFSSSASHSFRYQRYYPSLNVTPDQAADSVRVHDSGCKILTPDALSLAVPLQSMSHKDLRPCLESPLNSTTPARRTIIQLPARQPEPDGSKGETDRDLNMSNHTPKASEMQSENTSVTPQQNKHRHSDSARSSKENDVKITLPDFHNSMARSSRTRRPTQKAAENLELSYTELETPLVPADEFQHADKVHHGNKLSQMGEDINPDPPVLEARISEILQSTVVHHQEYGSETLRVFEPVQDNEACNIVVTGLEGDTLSIHTAEQRLELSEENGIVETHTAELKNSSDENLVNGSAVGLSHDPAALLSSDKSVPDLAHPIGLVHLASLEQSRSDVLEHNTTPRLVVTTNQASDGVTSSSALNPRKRRRDMSEESEFRPETERQTPSTLVPTTPAAKRVRTDGSYEAKRAEVSKLVRILILELVGLCSGLVPNVPWTLRRAMVPRWQEAGIISEQLTVKNIRASIKAHCESGKLKQITFAFRSKTGAMTRMSVLGLRGIDATSPAVLQLQKKMAEMEPADYFPPELEAESLRLPNETNKKRYIKELDGLKPQEIAFESSNTSKAVRSKRTAIRDPSPGFSFERTTEHQTHLLNLASMVERPLPSEPVLESEPELATSLNTGFLTLKISRLKELNLPTGTLREYTIPRLPPTIDSSAVGMNSDQQGIEPKRKPRGPSRRQTQVKETAHSKSDTPKVSWKPTLALPSSLDQVPMISSRRSEALSVIDAVSGSTVFEAEVDCVQDWELKFSDVLPDTRSGQFIFINHLMSHKDLGSATQLDEVEFKALVSFNTALNKLEEVDLPDTESWPYFVSALQCVEHVPTFSTRTTESRTRRPTKRKADMELDLEDGGDATPAPKKRKSSRTQRRPRRTLHTAVSHNNADISAWAPLRRNRIGQVLRHMTEEEKYEVVVAVVVVRTILGGIEKFIDWRIVLRLISNQEESVIRDSWRTMANRYRNDISELTDGLQYRYLEALSNDSVPSVNFDDVHATNWEGIYQWALTNLDKTLVKKIEELPASRVQLLRKNDYVFNEPRGLRDLLGYNVIHTVPRREEVLSGTVFGKPLTIKSPHVTTLKTKAPAEDEESDIDLCRAKSWVMATLLTPESFFDTKTIYEKLLTLAGTPRHVEDLLERAIKSLQRDKLVSRATHISMGNRDREDTPFVRLRRYEISAKFFEQFEFRRLITTPMLKRAAIYKFDILDVAFGVGETVVIAKDTILDDGEMVAILNLVAMGMLKIKPGSDVPNSLWGLGWQSHQYTTRMIDKKTLGFSVILSPVRYRYVYGDPIATTRAHSNAIVPRGEIDMVSSQGRIPIWFDITHRFQSGLWEMVLGVVLGLVSIRPGVEVRELVKMMWHSVAVEEVNLILEWAARLDLVKQTDSGFGWETCAWWWLGVGSGGGWRVDEQTVSDVNVNNRADRVPVVPIGSGPDAPNNDVIELANESGPVYSPPHIPMQSQQPQIPPST